MKYKVITLSLAIIIGVICAVVIKPAADSVAAANGFACEPVPTPVKTKAFREVTYTDGEFGGKEIVMTDAEWKRILSPAEFEIMRQQGTELPYTGALTNNHEHGIYYCAACGLAVFSSDAKFESGTGWPSFFKPLYKKNLIEKEDRNIEEVRTEVECARCHAHLGHVFDDGPQPTGLRYCMNSVALRFVKK
jgi:peptide-methionine (R)-S-oxide reductase